MSTKGEDDEAVPDKEHNMAEHVQAYRKRLNKWKNIGVWAVFIFVGLTVFSVSRIRYNLKIKDLPKDDHNNHSWIIAALTFGGLSIAC